MLETQGARPSAGSSANDVPQKRLVMKYKFEGFKETACEYPLVKASGNIGRLAGAIGWTILLAATWSPSVQAQQEGPKAILLVMSVVEVNESRVGWTNTTYSAMGPPYEGFRALLSSMTVSYEGNNATSLRLKNLAEIMRQQGVATVISSRPDTGVAALYDPVGPVVIVLQNVTPPTTSLGTPYEPLTMSFGYEGLVTVGEVRNQNLMVTWCEKKECDDLIPALRGTFAEEARYFTPRLSMTMRDERRMDELSSTMPAKIDAETASVLFRAASQVETNATRHLAHERVGQARASLPISVVAAFDVAHEKQESELAQRKAQLATRAASYKDQVGRAQNAQATKDATEESQEEFRLLRGTLLWTAISTTLAAFSILIFGGIQIWQTRIQHRDAQEALELERASRASAPAPELPVPDSPPE